MRIININVSIFILKNHPGLPPCPLKLNVDKCLKPVPTVDSQTLHTQSSIVDYVFVDHSQNHILLIHIKPSQLDLCSGSSSSVRSSCTIRLIFLFHSHCINTLLHVSSLQPQKVVYSYKW